MNVNVANVRYLLRVCLEIQKKCPKMFDTYFANGFLVLFGFGILF